VSYQPPASPYGPQPPAPYPGVGPQYPGGVPPFAAPPPAAATGPWITRRDLLLGVAVVGALLVLGALLGLVWQLISPPRPSGFHYQGGPVFAFEESEGFIASDGRFVLITAAVGLIAGILVWTRRSWRGPVTVAALAVGGLAGAIATDAVGRLTGGGTTSAPAETLIKHLPLEVHARALLLLEPLLAVLVYVICTLFANRDDLGRSAEAAAPPMDQPVPDYAWPPQD